MAWLEQLRTIDGQELPPRIKAEIRRELESLELVLRMIKTFEAERDAIALQGRFKISLSSRPLGRNLRLC